MQKLNEFLSKYFLLIIPILSIGCVWALFVPGYYGASDDVHIAWLYEMDYAVRILQFPPRFVPDLSFGFGYPLFNFVFPFPYYMAEVFHLIGFSLVDSIKIIFGLTMPISMIGMYLLGRRFVSPVMATTMAVLYGYAPYRAVDLYIRGAIGEIVAFMFLPWLVWSVIVVVDSSLNQGTRFRAALGGGLLLAGFILSHNITAYMFLPWLGILSLMLILSSTRFWRVNFLNLGALYGVGILGSSYFWVPALVESKLMKYDTVFNFIDHFPTLRQLITPYWGYGASVPGPYDGISFFLGYSNIIVLIVAGILGYTGIKRAKAEVRIIFLWAVLVLVWAFVMMNFRSSPVWQLVPMIAQFQFPWRFLILVSLAIPLLVILAKPSKRIDIFCLFIITITIIVNFSYFRPQDFLGRADGYFISKYLVYPQVDPLYLTQSEEYLRLPIGSAKRPDHVYPSFFGEAKINEEKVFNRLNTYGVIEASSSTQISINKYAFPGWHLKVDDKESPFRAGQPFGQINFELSPGRHTVQVYFSETIFRGVFNWISLITIGLALMGYVYTSLKMKKGLK